MLRRSAIVTASVRLQTRNFDRIFRACTVTVASAIEISLENNEGLRLQFKR
jgi:hypothetical protein